MNRNQNLNVKPEFGIMDAKIYGKNELFKQFQGKKCLTRTGLAGLIRAF